MTLWLALHYSFAAFAGWSLSKAWFGFWDWRDRRFWRRFYALAYGWGAAVGPMTLMVRFWSHVNILGPEVCWPWTGSLTPRGYGKFIVGGKRTSSHRVAYELEVGAIPEGMHVLHKCDNRRCVNPGHLFLGTNADNVRDKHEKSRGRWVFGEGHPAARLTEDDVLDIRSVHAFGGSAKDIASAYGMSVGAVRHVLTRRSWSYLP